MKTEIKRHEVSEELVDRVLRSTCPGGASVMAFLPMSDAWTAHPTARDVVRTIVACVLNNGYLSTPKGMVLLPVEPTDEMTEAFCAAYNSRNFHWAYNELLTACQRNQDNG